MLPYNYKYATQAFGLHNTSSLCYFNSLTQCLMSLPSFNEAMEYETCKISQEYNMLRKKNSGSSYNLASFVKQYRDNKCMQWNIDPNVQEDIHEGFILMMEALGDKLNPIFNIRYRLDIKCYKCNNITQVPAGSSPPELVIDMSNLQCSTKEEVEQYIILHRQIPDGYKCEKCLYQNSGNKPSIIQRYSIGKISSVIILLYKYNQHLMVRGKSRITQYFPNELDFESKNGPLHYKLVAYAEQFGSLGGGHYTATCLRPNSNGTGLSVVNMNDNIVSPSNFNPSPNTYMVFYHLV